MAKIFSVLAGISLLLTIFFVVGLTIMSFKKKPTKFWVWGMVVSVLATIIFYGLSFLGIFQLYSLTSH